MILKEKDDITPHLNELDRLLRRPSVSKAQREAIEDEIGMIRGGAKGEKEAAYHIDFGWKDGKNSAVIHDLRLEHEGRVAQIDHLILLRTLECHVLESKGFGSEIQINDAGEWEIRTRYGWKGIPSPVEQNRRHIEVLKSFIEDHKLVPSRLGLQLPISFHNWVLVAPGSHFRRKSKELDQVVKMDQFESRFTERLDKAGVGLVLSRMARIVSLETVEEIGKALIAAHKPATFNFAGKFGIGPSIPPPLPTVSNIVAEEPNHCGNCGLSVEEKVVNFCRLNAKKFGGRLLCQRCQKVRPAEIGCEQCGVELEDKVIAFCRFNSKRLGGRRLCRTCQATVVVAGGKG